MEKKTLNIVCVSKKISGKGYRGSLQHLNISGKCEIGEGFITFLGEMYMVLSTGTGLDTSCLTYEVKVLKSNSEYDIWVLYTDIPCEGSASTPENIRNHARRLVEWKDACGIREPM